MPDIEEQIRRAIEEGKFDHLPGKGKPLNLEDDPNLDAEWRMAYHVLKNGGFALPWIQSRNEILSQIEQARDELKRAWDWRQGMDAQKMPPALVERQWLKALSDFRKKIDQLNQQIRNYNLEAPTIQLHLPLIKLEDEVSGLQAAHDQ
jgi:DnaJ homolog subfamily C member 28